MELVTLIVHTSTYLIYIFYIHLLNIIERLFLVNNRQITPLKSGHIGIKDTQYAETYKKIIS